MKLVGIWHFSLNFQCLSLYVFLRQLFFSAPLRLYPYFNTACLVKRFFKLYERRGPRCHFDALRSSCDDKKTNRSCFLVVWWHLDSLNIRDIRRICSSGRTNSCCLRIFRWVPHRHCLNLCQLSFWGISTPVILSHFQYLQVEHDSPDINAEVQRGINDTLPKNGVCCMRSSEWFPRWWLKSLQVSKRIESHPPNGALFPWLFTSAKPPWNLPVLSWNLLAEPSLGICLDRWDWNNPVVLTHIQEKFET